MEERAPPSNPQDVVEHTLAHPPLRLRRLGTGYRIEDVELVLAELQFVVRERERELDRLRSRLEESEAEVGRLRGREREVAELDVATRRRSEEIEQTALTRARRVVADAELDADRIRGDARLRIDETATEFDELMRLKEGLLRSLRGIVREYQESIERVARGESVAAVPAPRARLGAEQEEVSSKGAQSGTEVELIAGPFHDFASLSTFEQALSKLPHVSDVYVRHFASERAVIELTLAEPAPLEDELRQLLPFHVEVHRAHDGMLQVDLAQDGSAMRDTG